MEKSKLFIIIIISTINSLTAEALGRNNHEDFKNGTTTLDRMNVVKTKSAGFMSIYGTIPKGTYNMAHDECTMKMIRQSFTKIEKLYVNIQDKVFHKRLLINLQKEFISTIFSDPESNVRIKSSSKRFLNIFFGTFSVEEMLRKARPHQGSKFLVLVGNLQQAYETAETFWKYDFSDVVATYQDGDDVKYYTFYPYSKHNCGSVGELVLVGTCKQSSGELVLTDDLFPAKNNDLKGCVLNVTLYNLYPAVYYDQDLELKGWEVELLTKIIEELKGVPNFHVLDKSQRRYQRDRGYSNLVENTHVGGGLAISLESITKTDFCLYGQSLCLTWFLPWKMDPHHSRYLVYKTYPPQIWIILALCMIVMAFIFKAFDNDKPRDIILKLFSHLLGLPSSKQDGTRSLLGSWLWFCLIMNAGFQGAYKSKILVRNYPPMMETTEEVLESNLKILGYTEIMHDVISVILENKQVNETRFLSSDQTTPFTQKLQELSHDGDTAYLGLREIVLKYLKSIPGFYSPQSCIMKYHSAFILKPNSHLTQSFSKVTRQFSEYGLTLKLRDKYFKTRMLYSTKYFKRVLKSSDPLRLNFDKMYGAFVIIFWGSSISLMIFVFEIFTNRVVSRIFIV